MTVLYSQQARAFLDTLPGAARYTVTHELKLIDGGNSLCYDEVRNEKLLLVGFEGPYRAKFMSVFRERGGIRAIFFFSQDHTLVATITYRDSNPYLDGK